MLCDAAALRRLKLRRRLRIKTNEPHLLSYRQRLIDVRSCGYSRPCSLADRNKQRGVLCYCRSFTPGGCCPMLFNPPLTHSSFHTSRVLGWTGTSLEGPHSLVSSFLAPSSATLTKILCPPCTWGWIFSCGRSVPISSGVFPTSHSHLPFHTGARPHLNVLNNHSSIQKKKKRVCRFFENKNQQHVNQQHAAISANFTHQLNNS